ncbi:MAG TPA: hypothetical protein VGD84_20305 [Pseudonocardiaceae bacterium]
MSELRSPSAVRIAVAVAGCPAVARLHGGAHGEVATYLPGTRVTGVRAMDHEIAVHVVGVWPATLAEIAGQVRTAAGPFTAAIPVSVTVEDLELPDDDETPAANPERETS